DERAERLAVALLMQVEDDRALAAVVLPEEQRAFGILAILVEGTDAPRGVPARRLDLDDVGAEPGERQPAGFRLLVGQLDDPTAGERTSHGALQSRRVGREPSPGFYATLRGADCSFKVALYAAPRRPPRAP